MLAVPGAAARAFLPDERAEDLSASDAVRKLRVPDLYGAPRRLQFQALPAPSGHGDASDRAPVHPFNFYDSPAPARLLENSGQVRVLLAGPVRSPLPAAGSGLLRDQQLPLQQHRWGNHTCFAAGPGQVQQPRPGRTHPPAVLCPLRLRFHPPAGPVPLRGRLPGAAAHFHERRQLDGRSRAAALAGSLPRQGLCFQCCFSWWNDLLAGLKVSLHYRILHEKIQSKILQTIEMMKNNYFLIYL